MSEIYNENLYNWIDNNELTEAESQKYFELIRAYSEFLITVNQDFKYNKTYLPAFFDDFKNVCNDISELNSTANIVKDCLKQSLEKAHEINGKLKVNINNILSFKYIISSSKITNNPEIHLSNQFEVYDIQKDKINIWIKFGSFDGHNKLIRVYDIAEEIQNTKKDYKEIIKKNIDNFIDLVKEVN